MSVASTMGHRAHAGPHVHGFLRHLVEMLAAMMVGMIVSAGIFVAAAGVTVNEAVTNHAVSFVATQAVGMTVAMVLWMRYRGHGWRGCVEMAVAMVAPALPLIALRATGVIGGAICGAYCALSVLAMLAVMLYRRSDYGGLPA